MRAHPSQTMGRCCCLSCSSQLGVPFSFCSRLFFSLSPLPSPPPPPLLCLVFWRRVAFTGRWFVWPFRPVSWICAFVPLFFLALSILSFFVIFVVCSVCFRPFVCFFLCFCPLSFCLFFFHFQGLDKDELEELKTKHRVLVTRGLVDLVHVRYT